MLMVCYPKCSTCQKAMKYIEELGLSYEQRDIKLQNPSADELAQWQEQSGLPIERFFNTSGLIYRSLNLKDKLPQMTQQEKLDLLATDGMLVKRPLLVLDDGVLVGFKPKEWEARLQKAHD